MSSDRSVLFVVSGVLEHQWHRRLRADISSTEKSLKDFIAANF